MHASSDNSTARVFRKATKIPHDQVLQAHTTDQKRIYLDIDIDI